MAYLLVVDNNAMNLRFMEYLFKAKGYRVKTAPSVTEGLRLIAEAVPCAILSDLSLPDRNGLDFLKAVKGSREWEQVPFLIISASSWMGSDVMQAQRFGAAKYLFRPIEPVELLKELEPYLNEARIDCP